MRFTDHLRFSGRVRAVVGAVVALALAWSGWADAGAVVALMGIVEGDAAPPQQPQSIAPDVAAVPADTSQNRNPDATAAGLTDRQFAERVRREGWVPRHAMSQQSQRLEAAQRRTAEQQRVIQTLTGATPAEDPEEANLKAAIVKLFPALGKLSPEHAERLVKAVTDGEFEQMAQTRDFLFGRTAHETAMNAAREWAKVSGRDPQSATPQQAGRIARELQAYIDSDQSGERGRRYDMNDSSLLTEFVQDLQDFYGPGKAPGEPQVPGQPLAQVAAPAVQQVQQVRGLPRTGPRTGPGPGVQPQRLDRKAVSEAARVAAQTRMGG